MRKARCWTRTSAVHWVTFSGSLSCWGNIIPHSFVPLTGNTILPANTIQFNAVGTLVSSFLSVLLIFFDFYNVKPNLTSSEYTLLPITTTFLVGVARACIVTLSFVGYRIFTEGVPTKTFIYPLHTGVCITYWKRQYISCIKAYATDK